MNPASMTNRRNKTKFFSILIMVLCANTGFAQPPPVLSPPVLSPPVLSEAEFFSDIPLIHSITRLPQIRSETPAAVTIIDRDMIRASGARNIADLFRLVPGFQVAYPHGARPSVTYHGIGDNYSRRMQVLVDGRSAYGSFLRTVIWSTLNINVDDIERIEVTRGPNTVTYGANAFLATINIITTHSAQYVGNMLNLNGGNHSLSDFAARFTGRNVRVTADYAAENGIDGIPDDYARGFLNVRSDVIANNQDQFMLQLGIGAVEPQLGTGADNFLDPRRSSSTTGNFEHFNWKREWGDGNQLNLQAYHNRTVFRDSYTVGPVALSAPLGVFTFPVGNNAEENRYDVEFHQSYAVSDRWRMNWGLGGSEDLAQSHDFFFTHKTRSSQSSRLFAQTEWHAFRNGTINAGLMWESTQIAGSHLSPRLAVNYHLENNSTVRAVWSQAVRTPSLFEQYGDRRLKVQNVLVDHLFRTLGGPRAEAMDSYELGYLQYINRANLELDLRLYQSRIKDYIAQIVIPAADVANGQAYSYRNEGDITVTGLDIEAVSRVSRHTRVTFNQSLMRATAGEFTGQSLYDSQQIRHTVPSYSGAIIAWHQPAPDWHVSAGVYWVAKMLWMQEIPGEEVVADKAYTKLDLRLARRFKFGQRRGELAFVVQNAGDRYNDFQLNQYYGTHAFASLRLDF